jgi:hypothetical protein
MHCNGSEELLVFEGFEDLAMKFLLQIDLALSAIAEAKPHHIISDMSCIRHSNHHATPKAQSS